MTLEELGRRADRRPAGSAGLGSRQGGHRAEHAGRGRGLDPERAAEPLAGRKVARARFAAIVAGQPPRRSPSPNAIAAGRLSHFVGSGVPVQSASTRKRDRRSVGSFAPCEMTSGRIAVWRSARTWRKALPFGPNSHLCPLPT